MNKKLLIGAAIAATLILTACVKKEAPKEEEQGSTIEKTQPVPEQPKIQEVPTTIETTEIPTRVEVEHQETNNTTTTIRREYNDAPTEQQTTPAPKAETVKAVVEKPAPKPEAPKPVVEKPAPKPQTASSSSQSEDDAVAAAIAAATPALGN